MTYVHYVKRVFTQFDFSKMDIKRLNHTLLQ